MEKKDVIQYVTHTPCNNNPAVLGSLLDELVESSQKPVELESAIISGKDNENLQGNFYSFYDEEGAYVQEEDASSDPSLEVFFPKMDDDKAFYLTYIYGGSGTAPTIEGFPDGYSLVTKDAVSVIPLKKGSRITLEFSSPK